MFNKYQKKKDDSKVLLLYLLLNGNDTEKIKMVEEVEDSRRRVIYGITSEVVNGRQFEMEIENIQAPVICSPQSYELYSESKLIHIYTPERGDIEICIHDMSVISKVMVIEKNCIVSSNAIERKSPADIEQFGFMCFYQYVLYGNMIIGRWKVSYDKDGLFRICYNPDGYQAEEQEQKQSGEKKEEKKKIELVLFSSVEIDKTSTYKFVIYIITKLRDEIRENRCEQNNFKMTDYVLVVNDSNE